MSRTKASPGILAILAAFRDSEDCDGDPTRPTTFPGSDEYWWSKIRSAVKAGRAEYHPMRGMGELPMVKLTPSGLALFREAFPDHPYTLDWLESERERIARLNIIVHVIFDGGRLSVNDVVAQFVREYFEEYRAVGKIESDWDTSRKESFGTVQLPEDENYHPSTYRFRYNRERNVWEFRKS